MRNTIALSSALVLAACGSEPAPEPVEEEVVETKTPEEQVTEILETPRYIRRCDFKGEDAARDVQDERGEANTRGMSERDAYFARQAFREETQRQADVASETAIANCFGEMIEERGLTETYETMKAAAEASPEVS